MSNKSLALAGRHHVKDTEAAEYADVDPSLFRRFRQQNKKGKAGGPRWIKIGGAVRYPVEDLIAWLASLPGGGGDRNTEAR